MPVPTTQIGSLTISRMIIGGNPFSGVSHQGPDGDRRMMSYYTTDRIIATLSHAESLGVTTFIGRADNHIIRMLIEYRDRGGKINWIAQSCPEHGNPPVVNRAINAGASAMFIHGGVMDNLYANDKLHMAADAVKAIKDAGLPAGVAAHNPAVIQWAEDNLDVDFYMCCYYNPSNRAGSAAHDPNVHEFYNESDRQAMVKTIAKLKRPAIHYKVLAAGRNDPETALKFAAEQMRPTDAVCIGYHLENKPDMIEENIKLLFG